MRRDIRFLALLVSMALGAQAVSQEPRPASAQDTPLRSGGKVPAGAVATVDGRPVMTAAFVDLLCTRFLRPKGEGHAVLENLEQEALVEAALRQRGLTVTESEVDAKVNAIKAEYARSAKDNKTFEQVCREGRVTPELFRAKTRGVVALEKVARQQLRIPDDKPVENLKLNTWLKDAKTSAKIERSPAKLRPGIVSMVDGEPILKSAFISTLLPTIDPSEVRRNLDILLQEIVMQRLLAEQKTSVSDADVKIEWDYKRREFESNPSYQGIPIEEIIRQNSGMEIAEYLATPGFRVNAGIGKLAKLVFDQARLIEAFETRKSLYGPTYHVRHLLVSAADTKGLKVKIRSFDDGFKLLQFVLEQFNKGMPFEDLVKQYSEDTGTKASGGIIPAFTPGRNNYEPALVEACAKLKPHEVSEPVKGATGWHLLRMDSIDPIPPMAEVEADLRRVLAVELFKKAMESATIAIDIESGLRTAMPR